MGSDLPPSNLWPSLLQSLAEVVKQLSGPLVVGIVLIAWREHFEKILEAIVALIDRATYLKTFGIVLKAPEKVRTILPPAQEAIAGKLSHPELGQENVVVISRELRTQSNVARTLLNIGSTSNIKKRTKKSKESISETTSTLPE